MEAVELLLWLLLVAVAIVGIGLASVACMGDRDDEEQTSTTQNMSTSKSVAEELFSADTRLNTTGKRVQLVATPAVYYVPTTQQR